MYFHWAYILVLLQNKIFLHNLQLNIFHTLILPTISEEQNERTLYVDGFPFGTTEDDLKGLSDEIVDVRIQPFHNSGNQGKKR